jgi:hypothetical protein
LIAELHFVRVVEDIGKLGVIDAVFLQAGTAKRRIRPFVNRRDAIADPIGGSQRGNRENVGVDFLGHRRRGAEQCLAFAGIANRLDLDEIAPTHVRVERAGDFEHFRPENRAIGAGGKILHAVDGARHVVARRHLFDDLKTVAVIHFAIVLVPRDCIAGDEVVLKHHREAVENQLCLFGRYSTHRDSPFPKKRIGLSRCRKFLPIRLCVLLPSFLEIAEIVGCGTNFRCRICPSRLALRRIAGLGLGPGFSLAGS